MTDDDLEAVPRQHGHSERSTIHLAIFETKGAISILPRAPANRLGSDPPPPRQTTHPLKCRPYANGAVAFGLDEPVVLTRFGRR
jgi:uncharacterized membrane protein YcaP (DUF421 family)